ncbi:MAG: outer membrane protein assembly factor BamD [candidate division WOR-3 bacterium]|nr:outer membrane protein assembly factor BamD [candidate division WOR-3 bacterium]
MKQYNLLSAWGFLLFIVTLCIGFFSTGCASRTVKKTEIVSQDTTSTTHRLYKTAREYLDNNDFEKSLELLYAIVDDFPKDELADDALYLIAEILSDPKNPDQDLDTAIEELERLIEDYPQSEYVARAKKMIKKLEKLLEEE